MSDISINLFWTLQSFSPHLLRAISSHRHTEIVNDRDLSLSKQTNKYFRAIMKDRINYGIMNDKLLLVKAKSEKFNTRPHG